MPSNMAGNTNHTTLLKNQSAIKYPPYMRFLSNFGCQIIFMRYVNFFHQQDSKSLFKGGIGHVTDPLVQMAYFTWTFKKRMDIYDCCLLLRLHFIYDVIDPLQPNSEHFADQVDQDSIL